MSAVPVDRYLAEFGAATAPVAPPRMVRAKPPEQPASPPDTSALLEQAYASGVESGRTAAKEAYDAQLAEETARWQSHLAEERDRWEKEEAAKFADALRSGLGAIEESLASATANVLKPFLADVLEQRPSASSARCCGAC